MYVYGLKERNELLHGYKTSFDYMYLTEKLL